LSELEEQDVSTVFEKSREKHNIGGESLCRMCKKLVGVYVLHEVTIHGRVPIECYYTCKEGRMFSSTYINGDCPSNSFEPRPGGEKLEINSESLRKHGFRKLSYHALVKKLGPNHPQAKRYGEIIVHPAESFLKALDLLYDIWLKHEEDNGDLVKNILSLNENSENCECSRCNYC